MALTERERVQINRFGKQNGADREGTCTDQSVWKTEECTDVRDKEY